MWIADWQTKRLECPDCGNPLDECSDPTKRHYPYRRICYPTMERAAAEAALEALRGETARYHDGTFTSWAKDRSDSHPYPAGAGESIGVADRDLTPWDRFTTERDASPQPSGEDAEPDDPEDDG